MGLLFFRDQEEYDKSMNECQECRDADSVFCDECEDKEGN
jgi:hypothetical protein